MDDAYLGLDFGDTTIGVSVGRRDTGIATALTTIRRSRPSKLKASIRQIISLLEEYRIDSIVLGLPLQTDGLEGDRAHVTREFAAMLSKRAGLPIILVDERYTTTEAYRKMSESGIPGPKQKQLVDEYAAMIILQDYLDNGIGEIFRLGTD